MQATEPEQGAGELEQRQEIGRALVVANEQRPALGEPRQRALDHPASRREPLLPGGQIELLLPEAAQVRHVVAAFYRRPTPRSVLAALQTPIPPPALGPPPALHVHED